MMLWAAFGEQWANNHAVTFDGENKLIYISPAVTVVDVKTDIYSNWKEWLLLYDNSKFPAAIRSTGGDPTISGEYAGDIYFMINGWRIVVSHSCQINGVLYSDDYSSPFVQADGTQLVTNKVSSLVNTVSVGGGSGISVADIEASTILAKKTDVQQSTTTIMNKLATIEVAISQIETAGLTAGQATMLLEMYELLGLDPTKPLVVTDTARMAGSITQQITTTPTETVVIRQ